MNDQQATEEYERFTTVAAAYLARDGSYGPVPASGGQGAGERQPLIFGRTQTIGMAMNVNLVALCWADGLTPNDLDRRVEFIMALVRTIGEQGNVEAQSGGKGRQVTALLLWVYTGATHGDLATAAAALRRDVRGSSFGRWPVDCAAILLGGGTVVLPDNILGRRRTGLATEILHAWQSKDAGLLGEQPPLVVGQQRRRDLARVLSGGAAPVTYTLLVLIGLFFAAMELSGGSTSTRVLVRFGVLVTPLVLAGQWWRLVSAAFLHIGWSHLLFNCWALYIYGPLVERLYGPTRFLTIYLLAAIAGDALSLPLVNGVSAGASGAIFGLFGATISLVIRHRRTLPSTIRAPLWRNAVAVVALNAVLSVAVAGINLYAHAGGFLAGLLLGAVLRPRPIVTDRLQGQLGTGVGIVLAGICTVALALAVGQLQVRGVLSLP
jgi:rhomboid protease GluP